MTKDEAMNKLKESLIRWTKFAEETKVEAVVETKFEDIKTQDGKTLCIEDGTTLDTGVEIYVLDDNGNQTPAEDGDYVLTDGRTITITGGTVGAIADSTEQPTEDSPADSAEMAAPGTKAKTGDSSDKDSVTPVATSDVDMSSRMTILEEQVGQMMELIQGMSNAQESAMTELSAKFSKFSNEPAVKGIKNTPVADVARKNTLKSDARFSSNKEDVLEIMEIANKIRNFKR